MIFHIISDDFDCLKSKKVVHKTIIKDWLTHHCEDAPDLKGYKNFSSWFVSF
jgi:hypothetical protein